MIKEYEVIPSLKKDNGETLSYTEVNSLVDTVFTKFNRLNSFNCGPISTGKFIDFNLVVSGGNHYFPNLYANHCGKIMHRDTAIEDYFNVNAADSIDQAIAKVNARITNLLNRI